MPETYGHLIVNTRAARNAVPVPGASITVYCVDDNGIMRPCQQERTDLNGQTPSIRLEAPSLEGTSPNETPPFATYRVDVEHPDFRPVTATDVAIFSGVTTSLPVNMVPPRTVSEQTQHIIISAPQTGPTGSGKE